MAEYAPIKSNTCTFSTVGDSASSTIILAANPQRKGASIVNTSTATLYLRMDGGTATTNGDLPQISGVWGVDGVISAEDAMAACGGGNLQVYSAGGLVEGNAAIEWRDAILAGRNLKLRPDEPI